MSTNTISLIELPRALAALGVSISYPALWRRTVQGIIPAHRTKSRWYVSASDLPQIAAALAPTLRQQPLNAN